MTVENVIGDLCGFSTVVIGIFLLNAFKDLNLNMENIKYQLMNPKNPSSNDRYMNEIVVHDPLMPDIRRSMKPGLITWTMDDDEC